MFSRKVLFLLPFILFLTQNGRAQNTHVFDPESPEQDPPLLYLSLGQAVKIALSPDGNTRIRIAEELLRQAKARSMQSRAALLPNVSASVGQQNVTRNLEAFGISFRLPSPEFDIPTFAGPFNVFDTRATASLNVLNLSSIRRYQASTQVIHMAEEEQENSRDQVRNTVARAYLSLLKARAGEEASKSSVVLAKRLVVLAEDQKSVGTGTGIEITRARVQLANEHQRLLSTANAVNRARFELLRILGLDLNIPVEPIEKMKYEPIEFHDLQQAMDVALKSRSDWKSQLKREEAARLQHSATRMERLPSVSLFADYGTIGSSINNSVPTRTYGFSVQVPIFDGGRLEGRRVESSSMLSEEHERTEDLRRQIELDLRLALDSLGSADLQVAAAREGLKLAENEIAQAERRFEAGVGSSIEVTDAQTRLERARENRIQALFIHNLARLDLHSAMGTIKQMIPGDRNDDPQQ